ncbi:BT_3987 domain-containing protein [Sphingobacterium siyangense]|uniref:BT_3987 domain-containing protein n=1 Tax=Sphingobacterium siyangense TaxID=459529 RepID=UPI0015FF4307|nr:DUF1735 domain-containing protein [Sphingobacterium siyangense]
MNIENSKQYGNVYLQSATNGAILQSYNIKDEWVETAIGAGYGGLDKLSQKISIELAIDASKVAEYNNQNNSNYELPPAGSYDLENPTVEIDRNFGGSNSAKLRVNAIKLGGTKSYIIPISIKNVSPELPVTKGLQTTYYIVNGVYESNLFPPIPLTGWKIIDFSDDDYDAIGGRAPYCIDGDKTTCWLSTYRRVNGWRPAHPHHVTIAMANEQILHGLKLYGRTGTSNAYLFPKTVQIETSTDGQTWKSAGIFIIAASSDETAATMYFEKSTNAKYFKVTVLNSAGNGDTTAIAELEAF